MRRIVLAGLCCCALTLGLSACSDDADPTLDGGTVQPDQATADRGALPDVGTTPDRGSGPDSAAPDQATAQPDASGGKLLTKQHTGWKSVTCGAQSCHGTLPVKGHTETNVARCAHCHGGNGACDPNQSNKPHTKSMSCVGSCHGSTKHGFTSSPDCISCHFAAAGLDGC